MKRSEMIKRLQKRFWFGESEVIADLADEIIDFLVEQGMQPPPVIDKRKFGPITYYDWEPENEAQ